MAEKILPEGYEKVSYCRCGDFEVVEIIRPVTNGTIITPDIRVSAGINMVSEDIADKLRKLLNEQIK